MATSGGIGSGVGASGVDTAGATSVARVVGEGRSPGDVAVGSG